MSSEVFEKYGTYLKEKDVKLILSKQKPRFNITGKNISCNVASNKLDT